MDDIEELKNEIFHAGILIIIVVILYWILPMIDGGEFIFSATVSEEYDSQVNLTTDFRYEIRVADCGSEKAHMLIHKGPDVVFNETFAMIYPEDDYLPYRPKFTIRENGTYQVRIKDLRPGEIRIGIRQYPRTLDIWISDHFMGGTE